MARAPAAGEGDPGFADYLGDADGVMWTIERDPHLRLTFTAAAVLDTSPDWDRLVRRVDRTSRRIPRMRQTVAETPLRLAPPRWVVDPDFCLEYHLRRVNVPPPGTLRAALDLGAVLGMSDFDKARPLWEFTLVDGLDDGRAVLLMKIHHTVTDGVGGMRLALELLDDQRQPAEIDVMPDAPEPGPEPLRRLGLAARGLAFTAGGTARAVVGTSRGAAAGLARLVRHPAGTLADAAAMTRSIARVLAPESDTLSPIMTGRSIRWGFETLEYPVGDLLAAAHAVDATLNHVFVSAVAGGFHRYHQHHDVDVAELRMTMPVNYRRPDDPLGGNRFVPARMKLPVDIADPAERVRAVGKVCRAWQAEPALPLTDAIAAVLNRLPPQLTTAVIGGMVKHDDFTASNIPGLTSAAYVAGARLDRLYVLGSPSGASADVTLVSHGDTACVGITVDRAAIPDGGVLIDCLDAAFAEVLTLAPEATTPRSGQRSRAEGSSPSVGPVPGSGTRDT